jgi:hypothetical protein
VEGLSLALGFWDGLQRHSQLTANNYLLTINTMLVTLYGIASAALAGCGKKQIPA